jgi:pimeloyl-ACP methyl ester carboxylesterase
MPTGASVLPDSIDCQTNGIRLRVLSWPSQGESSPFLLLHGLASNARFWEPVAARLAAAGHAAYAPDLRGHGQSDTPVDGYDFETVTEDLAGLVSALSLRRFIVAGHSWGGHVALDFASRHNPDGLGLIDGGFTQLSDAPEATWENVEQALTPPRLAGTAKERFLERLETAHPSWPADVPWKEIVMANFEVRRDGTIAPHLTFENHMQVVRALWEFPTYERFRHVRCPVLIAAARPSDALARRDEAFLELKRRGREQAMENLARVRFVWMDDTDHDIPLHRPGPLADLLLHLAGEAQAE